MELISVQSLTLLTTIIAVISNFLSINEKIAKNGLVNTLKIISYYILPIIFIQQILLLTYEAKATLAAFLSAIPILTLIIANVKKIIIFDKDDIQMIWLAFFSAVFLIINIFLPCIGFENYDSQITNYINEMKNYKISIELYQYLIEHLFFTLCLMIDVIEIILLFLINFREMSYFITCLFYNVNNINSNHYELNIEYKKMFGNIFALVFLTVAGKPLANYIIGLF